MVDRLAQERKCLVGLPAACENAGKVINSEGSFRLVRSQDTFLKFKGPAKSLFGLLVPTHIHLHVGNIDHGTDGSKVFKTEDTELNLKGFLFQLFGLEHNFPPRHHTQKKKNKTYIIRVHR